MDKGGTRVLFVCRLDVGLYHCVADKIITDEVIITDERIQHIKARHPGDYERFVDYMAETIKTPDYIIEDKKANTAIVLKEFNDSGQKFRLVLRLKIETDPEEYKNSILSFWHVGETSWKKTVKNKNVLYSRKKT